MYLRRMRRRIEELENSWRRTLEQSPLEQVERAARRLSDEDLAIVIRLEGAGTEAGSWDEREQAARAAWLAALDEEFRQTGYSSWEALQRWCTSLNPPADG